MFKVNNRNTRTRCKICSKLTIKAPERHQRMKEQKKRQFSFLAPIFSIFVDKRNCHNSRAISPTDFTFGSHIQCEKGSQWVKN